MEFGGLYGFQHLPKAKFSGFEDNGIRENLKKWSMIDGLRIQAFSFNRPFKTYLHEEFIQDFLSCPAVTSTLERAGLYNLFGPMGIPAEKIQMSEVKCTLTSVELFDKLFEGDRVIRKSGAIVKCLPEYITPKGEGSVLGPSLMEIEVGDKLRKLILMKDGDYYENDDEDDLGSIFNPEERDEFLFRLFGHLVIGGSLCQYEDLVRPYLETTKILYKDIVSVALSPLEGQRHEVVSSVYKIHSVQNEMLGSGEGDSRSVDAKDLLFHKPEFNNFFYISVNPTKQTCFTLYHHV